MAIQYLNIAHSTAKKKKKTRKNQISQKKCAA